MSALNPETWDLLPSFSASLLVGTAGFPISTLPVMWSVDKGSFIFSFTVGVKLLQQLLEFFQSFLFICGQAAANGRYPKIYLLSLHGCQKMLPGLGVELCASGSPNQARISHLTSISQLKAKLAVQHSKRQFTQCNSIGKTERSSDLLPKPKSASES